MQYTVKVSHRRFLNKQQADDLTSFGIKVVLNNHVYGEYSSHFPSNIEITEEKLEQLKNKFTSVIIESDKITIDFTVSSN